MVFSTPSSSLYKHSHPQRSLLCMGDHITMGDNDHHTQPLLRPRPDSAVFTAQSDDIAPIVGAADFAREFLVESKKLWYLAGPAMFTSVCQYSLGAITQVFSGHVSTIALAAVSVENSVIAGFCLGITVPTKITDLLLNIPLSIPFNLLKTSSFRFYTYNFLY